MFKTIKNDLPASIVVFFVAIPLCLGIALASGAPLFSGLIAGIIGGIVVGDAVGSSVGDVVGDVVPCQIHTDLPSVAESLLFVSVTSLFRLSDDKIDQ